MTAHGGKHAHDSDPADLRRRSSKYVNVDSTGVSMSWKTAVSVVAFIVMGAIFWTVFTATLSTKADMADHGGVHRTPTRDGPGSLHPHEVMIEQSGDAPPTAVPIAEQVTVNTKSVITVKNEVGRLYKKVDNIEDGIFEQRAEDLAYRAVEAMPRVASDEHKLKRFQRVKRKAVSNLKSGGDIRDGLAAELDF